MIRMNIAIAHALITIFSINISSTPSQYIDIACDENSSCLGRNISSNAWFVDCYGYLSCSQASISSTYVDCSGSYSCYKASHMTMQRSPSCYGLLACGFINSISVLSQPLYCHGERSCYSSTIDGFIVLCRGSHSCAETTMHLAYYMYIDGYLSVKNAQLISSATTTYYIFRGVESGKGATVMCNSGHNCFITCYLNACNDLTLDGDGTTTVTCNIGASKSDICPNGHEYVLSSFINYTIPSIDMDLNNSYVHVYKSCNNDTDNQCDGNQHCQKQINLTQNCCTGAYTCTVSKLTVENDIPDVVRCDARYACNGSEFQLAPMTDTYASGFLSLLYADVYSGKDLFCTGDASCVEAVIYHFTNVYCLGYCSCTKIYMENVANAFMYQICRSYNQVIDVKNNMYCIGANTCSLSTISNVWGSVVSIGYGAMYDTNITNATHVCHSV